MVHIYLAILANLRTQGTLRFGAVLPGFAEINNKHYE